MIKEEMHHQVYLFFIQKVISVCSVKQKAPLH